MTHLLSILISFFLFLFFGEEESRAVESTTTREAVVAPRAKRFYRENRARQYLSLGGSYTSDYNSKNYQFNSRYLYQSNQFIHEINFDQESSYADSGSGKNKQYDTKKSELYDFSLASKARFSTTPNYGVFYYRFIYDDLSKYYRDTRTAVGLGRMFFKDSLEFDASIGYHDVHSYGYEVDFIASWRANFKINDKLTFIQRAYWFFDHESVDNQIKTSLIYRLGEKVSFELRHTFEKRRYEEDDIRVVTNQVNRGVTIGLVFDLN
jgi:hypothetical protein